MPTINNSYFYTQMPCNDNEAPLPRPVFVGFELKGWDYNNLQMNKGEF